MMDQDVRVTADGRYVIDAAGRYIPVISGGDEADDKAKADRQALVDAVMAGVRSEVIKPLATKIDALVEDNKATKAQVSELSAALKKAVDGDGADDDDDASDDDDEPEPKKKTAKADGTDNADDENKPLTKKDLDRIVRFSTKKLATQVESLTKTVADERKARNDAEVRARDSQRDQMLTQALTKARVVDIRAAKTLMGQNVRWDEAKEQFVYTSVEGVDVPMSSDEAEFGKFADALEQDIPAFLRPSATNQGGSGSNVPKSVTARKDAETRLEAAKKRSKEDPRSDSAAAELLAAQREVNNLAEAGKR